MNHYICGRRINYILELSNSDTDPSVSIARARVIPNTSTKLHYLKDTVERYIILQGEGEVSLANLSPKIVSTGDIVIIPKNCPQAIRNCGECDLIFLVICSPRFTKENYIEHGKTESDLI